jgi:Glyoxalase-like domain
MQPYKPTNRRVPEGRTAKNRVHLDVRVAGGGPGDEALRERRIRDKAAELVAAGATVVREHAFGDQLDHIVMQDPEGPRVSAG